MSVNAGSASDGNLIYITSSENAKFEGVKQIILNSKINKKIDKVFKK